ncbi:substrate-binding domain-containing protein [Planctomicrobium sp. SH664]|uniref:AraC family transcriptional regulator n=1 Tax=Planctomicrobium sp. SH664 TaxID=3448125 RepID=UPI003F5C21F3
MVPGRRHIPHVAILIETSRSYGRGLLLGVRRYLTLHGPWSVFLELRALESDVPAWLQTWRGEGILTRTGSQKTADLLGEVGVPTVELRATRLKHDFPFIGVDNAAVGRMVAEHLLERGFRNFAFYDINTEIYFEQRRASFHQAIEVAGFTVSRHQAPGHRECPTDWERHQEDLVDWLHSLPKPVGVMACTDQLGFWLLDACRRAGISVPEEVAVVGVEDDETLCEVSIPPMSSVRFNAERIGFQAAELLESMMSGGVPPSEHLLVPPLGITVRPSSDILAIEDRELAKALYFIRQQACAGISVQDVLQQVPMSRSSLERKVRGLLGRSPQAEINHIKIERAKILLRETDWNLDSIARRTGFGSAQLLCERFKSSVGLTPGSYRGSARGDKNPEGKEGIAE